MRQGVRHLAFTGGEPLLADGTIAAAVGAKMALSTVLVTNGRLLTAIPHIDLIRAFDWVQVALQSSRAAVHDAASGADGAWEQTVAGIEHLLKAKLPLGVVTTLTSWSYQTITEMPAFLRSLGVRFLGVNRMCPPPAVRRADNLSLASSLIRSVLTEVVHRCSEHGLNFRIVSGVPTALGYGNEVLMAASRSCGLDRPTGVTIRPDGTVAPCPPLDLEVGTFQDLASAVARKLQIARDLERKAAGKCRACKHFAACRGGCRAAAFNAYGMWEHPDPFCTGGA